VRNPLAEDLEQIRLATQGLWEEMRGQRLFLTGGTDYRGQQQFLRFTVTIKLRGLGLESLDGMPA